MKKAKKVSNKVVEFVEDNKVNIIFAIMTIFISKTNLSKLAHKMKEVIQKDEKKVEKEADIESDDTND